MRKNSGLLCTVCQLTKRARFASVSLIIKLDFIIMLLLSLFSHLFCLCRYLMAAQSQGPAVSAIPRLNINDRFGCKTFQTPNFWTSRFNPKIQPQDSIPRFNPKIQPQDSTPDFLITSFKPWLFNPEIICQPITFSTKVARVIEIFLSHSN